MAVIHPYLINDVEASGRPLVPISTKEKKFDECWLQELLFLHSSIIPTDEVNLPLISLGRELFAIDDLFVSPNGLLTIVETKLWRNPEAHRTVVAQVLDYAKTLTTLKYHELDDAVRAFTKSRNKESTSIFDLVKKGTRSFDKTEIEFESLVQDSLSNGRFSLLIVGDKIYSEVTQLAEIIQSTPNLQYSISFLELNCFKLDKETDWPLLVVPGLVTRTKEVTRAVVRIIYEEKKPEIQVVAIEEEPKQTRGKTNAALFLALVPLNVKDILKGYIERWKSSDLTLYWGQVGFSLRVLWHGKLTTVFEAYPNNVGILTEKMVKKSDIPQALYNTYRERLLQASSRLGNVIYTGARYPEYTRLEPEDVMLILDNTDKLAGALLKEQRISYKA